MALDAAVIPVERLFDAFSAMLPIWEALFAILAAVAAEAACTELLPRVSATASFTLSNLVLFASVAINGISIIYTYIRVCVLCIIPIVFYDIKIL